jgi:hypothetical protein
MMFWGAFKWGKMGSFDEEHARANSSSDQSKRGVHSFLESDWIAYTVYFILVKF